MNDDLISRQAAVDTAVKMFKAWYGGSVLRDMEIRARFDTLPPAQQCMTVTSNTMVSGTVKIPVMDGTTERLPSTQQWIPCSERLPEPNEKVGHVWRYYLVQNEYGDMMVATYRGNSEGESWWEQMYSHKPTEDAIVVWMPLPEPYKEKYDG